MPPSTPAPAYSLKPGTIARTASPSRLSTCCTATVSAGRRTPRDRNTSAPAPGRSALAARVRNSPAPATVYGGSVCTVSIVDSSRSGSGSARSCSTTSTGNGASVSRERRNSTIAGSSSTTVTDAGPDPCRRANSASASETRSSSPSTSTRRPVSAGVVQHQRALVAGVLWVWSSSTRTGGAAAAGSASAAARSSGASTPRPAQVGQRPVTAAPGSKAARPAAVSRAGRSVVSTPRGRSSPQIAATTGSGSAVARPTPSRRRRRRSRSAPAPAVPQQPDSTSDVSRGHQDRSCWARSPRAAAAEGALHPDLLRRAGGQLVDPMGPSIAPQLNRSTATRPLSGQCTDRCAQPAPAPAAAPLGAAALVEIRARRPRLPPQARGVPSGRS